MTILFVFLALAFALAWLREFRKRTALASQIESLKLVIDAMSIHRDSHGHFMHPGGRTPLVDCEEL